ncbi:MAG: hypothetical protein WAM69_13345 [Candidatus Sulfotelmatobacter sp.]
MNRKTKTKIWPSFLPLFLVVVLAAAPTACQKQKPPAEEEVPPTDHVAPSPVGGTRTILHKAFTVSTSVNFPFEIPAHAAMPRLHGNYKSFVGQLSVQSSDDSANVDFLLLNDDQYADFVHGRAGEVLFSANASHDQDVDVSLPATDELPQKYHLIFRSTPGGAAKKVVQADFTVDF